MVPIDTVLIKVASRCNIDCSYCYVYNMGDTSWARMPKLISDVTVQMTARCLASLLETQGRGFAVVLHGGNLSSSERSDLTESCRHWLTRSSPDAP